MTKRFTILAVDDDPVALRIVTTALHDEYDIRTAESGAHAINQIAERRPDLILLDILMPDLNGFEVCRLIKSDPACADIPIIFLTSLDLNEAEFQGVKLGVSDYLTKPINCALLELRVRSHIALKERTALVKEQQCLLDRYHSILQTSMDGVWRVDMQGNLLEVNATFCAMSGYSEHELLGMNISDLEAQELDGDIANHTLKIIKQGEDRFETRHRRKDGTIFDVEISVRYLPGQPEQMVAFLRDITPRKRAEEALWNEKAFLRCVIDSANDLIYFKDCNSVYLGCNKASEIFTGILEHEQIGKTDFDLLDHDIAEVCRKRDQAVLAGRKGVHTEEWVTYPDGSRILLDTLKTPFFDKNGQPIGLVGISRDITDRRQAEEERLLMEAQFQQAQKLESLGVLAGGIAHDFNNILAIIIGHCSLSQLRPESAPERIAIIENAAERAAELCQQMLAYAGKTEFIQSQTDMRLLVDEMVKMLQSTISQNVTITQELSSNVPAITGDASQLRQIVMNLIINAAEAIGEEQGKIRVALSEATVTFEQSGTDHLGNIIVPGRYICLEVSDNGCGMDEETRRRIFEPFFTTKFTGRGLGLSATLGIIASHAGALQLASHPGQGTTFKVYLPVQTQNSQEEISHIPVAATQWQGSGTVLLVEDEKMIAMVASTMLEELGFTIITASNGLEALELYQQKRDIINMVVTDMGMPVMDGYELVRELKKISPNLPIIISSGFGDTEVSARIDPYMIAGLISKPYGFDQLSTVMKSAMEKSYIQ
jgi:PAS domain S-box-containing protein